MHTKLVVEPWPKATQDHWSSLSAAGMLRQWMAHAPHMTACSHGSRSWSYADLDVASRSLAEVLYARGIRRGDEVPIFLARCFESVAAIVAMVRLGICFVPMDAESWGQARVDAVCQAVKPKLVVCAAQTDLRTGDVPVITVAAEHVNISHDDPSAGPEALDRDEDEDSPMYVIFTSGTTGTPKGVVIPRRCVDNYVQQRSHGDKAMPFNLGVEQGDRVLLLFSLAFDAALGVLFSTLCWGGELVLSQPDSAHEDARTCTILPATPSLLLSLGDPSSFSRVRSVFLGGEAPNPEQVRQWSASHRRIFNCYGPTEATICASMGEMKPGFPIVLGQAMADTELLVLECDVDGQYHAVEEGEIFITGPGLASGYYKNDDLTAERFITWNGRRMYRTFDHARVTPDGIAFCGRQDAVVKNRGYLINLDLDVTPALLAYPGVISAVSFKNGDILISVVTPDGLDTLAMRKQLAQTHDRFVVPDVIVARAQMPRTSNGKIDIPSLKASILELDPPSTQQDFQPHEESASIIVRDAVAEALGRPPTSVPMSLSFWDLGGNSLAAVRVLSCLHRRGHTMRMEKLFTPKPLSAISDDLEMVWSGDHVSLTNVNGKGSEGKQTPMSLTQLGMVRSSIRSQGMSYMLIRMDIPWPLEGIEDPIRLRDAWNTVLERHKIFGTTFDLATGIQRESVKSNLGWSQVQVPGHGPQAMGEAVERASDEIWGSVSHEYDSDTFVPRTAMKLLVGDGTKLACILWLVHHSLVDGWSIGIIMQEVNKILCGEVLSQQRAQFSDLASIIPQYQTETYERRGRKFWKDTLAPVVDVSPLRLFGSDSIVSSNETASSSPGVVKLGLGISMKTMDQVCGVNKVSPATIFFAAWATLLRAYAPQKHSHVVFGAVFSGREFPFPGIEDVVGPVINTCPVVIKGGDSMTKAAFLESVSSTIRLTSSHQWSATQALEEQMPGSHARVFQTAIFPEYDLSGISETGWILDRSDRPEFELTLSIRREPGSDNLEFRLMYDRSKQYTEKVMSRLVVHFRNLTYGLLDSRCDTMAGVRDRMLDPGEFLALTGASSTLTEPYVGPPDLKTAFETGVDQWSDVVAIESPTQSMTYGELDRMANRLARRITALIRPGDAVGVVSDRSMAWLVAVISVIKAGCIYVPVDVKLPVERVRVMLETAGARLCLFPNITTKSQLPHLLDPSLCLEELESEWEPNQDDMESQRLETITRPDDYAYITFTSGSTGTPKGVQISHGAILSYLSYGPGRMSSRPGRRHAQMFSPGFDVSQAEIFGTLCFGATLVLADPENPFGHLDRVHATMITPSFLSLCDPESLPMLDTILFAGEAVPQDLADRWAVGTRTVYNSYGPCECTIGCLFQPLQSRVAVTLGRSIPRLGVYLLDEEGRPVPIGVPGEICLSGPQVAEGYIGGASMEKMNRTRFVPDPFVPGFRMYHTGDSAVWTESMEPRFLGRFDHQVKVRGFRVELNEIENVIRSVDNGVVRRAAAVVQGDIITAFVEPETVDIALIQAGLRSRLPDYACPSRIVPLPTLPTMANQKLDRKRLQAYEVVTEQVSESTVCENGVSSSDSLQSPVEYIVAEAWREAIELPRGTVLESFSDFLTLGGSSLSQIRVAQIVCLRMGIKIPLKIFLWNTTLSTLSHSIEEHCSQVKPKDRATSSVGTSDVISMRRQAVTHLERELVLLTVSSPTPQAFNVAARLRLIGPVNLDALEKAARMTSQLEPVLFSCFDINETDDTVSRKRSEIPCDIVRSSHAPDMEDSEYSGWVSRAFDLTRGPLTRIMISGSAAMDRTDIVLVQHHAITDKSSMKLLLHRIQSEYRRQISAVQQPHPHKDIPDYTLWAQQQSQQEHLPDSDKTRADYWRKNLANLPSSIWKRRQSSRSEHEGRSTTLNLKSDIQNPRCMEFFVSLVAKALFQLNGIADVVIGVPFVDRTVPGTEDMLGVFLDRLPMRVRAPSPPSATHPSSLMVSVGHAIRNALANSMPFEDIIAAVDCEIDIQVMVVYNRREDSLSKAFSMPGMAVESVPVQTTGAKFPLLVEFGERDDGTTTVHMEYMENIVAPEVVAEIGQEICKMWSLE